MAINVDCGSCGNNFRVRDELSGRTILCPQCKSKLKVEAISPVYAGPVSSGPGSARSLQSESPAPRSKVPVGLILAVAGGGLVLTVAGLVVGLLLWFRLQAPQSVDPAVASNTAAASNSLDASNSAVVSESGEPQPSIDGSLDSQSEAHGQIEAEPATETADDEPSQTAPVSSEVVDSQVPSPAAASQRSVEDPLEFKVLPLDEPATSFAMTEDGRFLIVTHMSANKVSVYDVIAEKVVQTMSVNSPRTVLCRNNQVYVGQFPDPRITVLKSGPKWTKVDELKVGQKNIVHLSAPSSKNFRNEILVTCHGEGRTGSYEGQKTFLLNVESDKSTDVNRQPLVSVSFDGKTVICQNSFNLSPSGGITAFAYADFVGGKGSALFGGGVTQTPYVYQVHQGSYWLSDTMVFGGVPIKPLQEDVGGLLIPDLSRKVVYILTSGNLSAHALNVGFTEIGQRTVQLPAEIEKNFHRLEGSVDRRRAYMLDHPVAFTHADQLFVFVHDRENNTLLSANGSSFITSKSDLSSAADSKSGGQQTDASTPASDAEKTEKGVIETPSDSAVRSSDEMAEAGPGSDASESALPDLGLPERIVSGKAWSLQLPETTKFQYALKNGPDGMELSADGKLTWKPNDSQVGIHELKIQLSGADGQEDFLRPQLEVVDQQLVAAAGGDLSKVDQLKKLELDIDHYSLSRSLDGKSLYLLQGDKLRVMDSDGISVESERQLPERYDEIRDRGPHLVAISRKPAALDVIDKRSLKKLAHYVLESPDLRVLDVTDIALHPTRRVSFLAIKHDIELPRFTVIVVDETTGSIEVPGILGTYVAVSPDGDSLYTGYSDIYERGSRFHINPNWNVIEIPEYGSVDMLLAWDLTRGAPRLRDVIRKAGGNGTGVRLSPDGDRVVYLSHVGYPSFSGNLGGVDARDFEAPTVTYATKEIASTKDLAFHPTLPWVACPGGSSAVLFHRETGEILERRLLITKRGVGEDPVERVEFSPDGQGLLLVCGGGETGRYLCRIGLAGVEGERRLDSSPRPKRAKSKRQQVTDQKIPAAELDALQAVPRSATLSSVQIGKLAMNAVVQIQSDEGTGTGIVIGRNGYILTCEHLVPLKGDIEVQYQGGAADQLESDRAQATVLLADAKNDIALLKIEPKFPLTTVGFKPSDYHVEAGEEITVIGNPGLGSAILTNTMTTGIVSNPNRDLDGLNYIQTSAAVNPGNSGGPMIDPHGEIIGMVSLKADIEATAFAIPVAVIREVLNQVVKSE